jgi:hypothetical protein
MTFGIVTRHVVRRPLEVWSFRIWPLVVVFLWASIILTGGMIGYNGWFFFVSAWTAMLGSAVHFLFPYNQGVRYAALIANLAAMSSRALDYLFEGHRWEIVLAGFSIWTTLAIAKVAIFFLSATLVEMRIARLEIDNG